MSLKGTSKNFCISLAAKHSFQCRIMFLTNCNIKFVQINLLLFTSVYLKSFSVHFLYSSDSCTFTVPNISCRVVSE